MTGSVSLHSSSSAKLKPGISVIINVYNGESTIERAIRSVVCQTHLPNQFIIWDNQSSDSTQQICSLFSEITDYIVSASHTSLGEARCLALEHVNYEWVCFLDCDDIWYPQKLAEQFQYARSDVGLIYSGVDVVSTTGKHITRFLPPKYKSDFIISSLLRNYNINMVTPMLNFRLMCIHNLSFDSRFYASEEQDLFYRLAQISRVVTLRLIHGACTISETSLTNQSLARLGSERRMTLQKLLKSPSALYILPSIQQSLDKSYYYDAVYHMSACDYPSARSILFRLSKRSLVYLFLFSLSFFPCLWRLFHLRSVKTFIARKP